VKGILTKSVVFSVDIQIIAVLTLTIGGDRIIGLVALGDLARMVGGAGRPRIGGAATAGGAGRRAVGVDGQVDASRCSYQVARRGPSQYIGVRDGFQVGGSQRECQSLGTS